MPIFYKPGTTTAPVGEYIEVGPRGERLLNAWTTHVRQPGKRLSPTRKKGNLWKKR